MSQPENDKPAEKGTQADAPDGAAPASIPTLPWDQPEQMLKALGAAWREATDYETPTLLQLLQTGVKRVDVDAVAGYVAVVAEEDTHRVIGIRRDLVAPLVAVLTRKPTAEITALLARGPARIETGPPAPAPLPRARRSPA